ncbi:DUF6531 domain-containing protein, partial [Verrucomicrobium sp. BvORR106]|uniref:DUF6531 domain-containing protein n=1 Tax=Verrucomicrobium sp. BvORR106 TaxID=1403819 RepID=UPI00056F349D
DTEVVEGLAVEGYLPSGTKSIREWVRKYLKAEANDPLWTLDAEDRTPGNIFLKDLDKGLRQNWPGLAKDSLGVRFRNRKFNRVQWKEFPQPTQFNTTTGTYTQSDRVSANGSRFDTVDIEIVNDQDTNKKITLTGLRLADLHNRRAVINFLPGTTGNYTMRFAMEPYDLDNVAAGTGDFTTGSDPYLLRRQVRDVAVTNTHKNYKFKVVYHRQRNYGGPVGVADQNLLGGWAHFAGINNLDFGPGGGATASSPSVSVFGLGDLNAFCLNSGRVTDRMLKVHLEPFWKHEQARAADANLAADYDLIQGTTAYLMGMSYYQRVSRSFDTLKDLFKVHTVSMRAHGFAQFGAKRDGSGNPVVANAPLPNSQTTKRVEQIYPVVDMNFSRTAWAGYGDVRPDAGGQGMITGADFMTNLFIAEISSLEDHTIQKYVNVEDTDAVSTVNLIHRIQQDGNAATNVIELTADNYLTEKTKTYAFGGSTKTLAAWAGGLWTSVEAAFAGWDKNLARVYITPGPVAGAGGNWKGMGALIIGKSQAGALIGQINGGWGGSFFTGSSSYVYDDWSWSTTALSSTTTSNWGGSTSYASDFWSDTSSSISMSLGSSLWGSSVSQSSYTSLSQSTSLWSGMSTSILGGDSYLSYADQYFMGGVGLSGGSLSSAYDSYLSMPSLISSSLDPGGNLWGTFYSDIGLGSDWAGDPVNMVTGELYADEVDLVLPGPIPLQVRRNYSSQSSHAGSFGFGWKMAYFPYIVPTDNEAKLQVAELDGSVLVYTRNTANTSAEEWIVRAEDNPHLSNGSGMEIGSVRNLFRNRILRTSPGGISTYTLYGVDGSTRVYEVRSFPAHGTNPVVSRQRPYLRRWTDAVGNYLEFKFYGDSGSGNPWNVANTHSSFGQLARVQASNGNFFGFNYDVYGHIVEVFAGDGRRISYRYDGFGDLVEVTLPDNSWARYEYLHEQGKVGSTNNLAWYSTHLIKKEVRPGGRIVESDYQLYVQGETDAEGNAIGAGSDRIGKASHLRRVTLQRATVGKHGGANERTLPAAESYETVRNATYAYVNSTDANGMTTGRTEILDAYDRKTIYYYTNNRLTKVFDPVSTVTNAVTGTGTNAKMEQEWFTSQDVINGVPGAYAGGLKAMAARGQARTEYAYNSSGDVTEIRVLGDLDGDGTATDTAVTGVSYNGLHLPELIIHPDPGTGLATGKRTRYFYQDVARPYLVTRVEEQDSGGGVLNAATNSYYDVFSNPSDLLQLPFAKGLVQTTKTAEGTADEAVTELLHDARGFLTKRTAYSGQGDQVNYPNLVTEFLHNLRGELVEERIMDATVAKKVNRYAYDDSGRPIWWERLDGNGQQIAWDYTYYNLTGDVEWKDGSRTRPEDYTYMRYDGAGRPVERVSWRSQAKLDGTGVEAPSGEAVFATHKFFYNLFGDLIKSVDARGNSVKFGYDDIGRRTSTEAHEGDWENGGQLLAGETSVYDDALRKVTQTDAHGGVTQSFFTSDGRPRRKINPDGTQLEWRYYLDRRVKQEPLSEHLYHEITYNDASRTATRTLKNANGQTLASESVTSDRRGNQVTTSNLVGHITTSTYDKLNRLITRSVPAAGATSAAQLSTMYYDATGLRNKVVNGLGESTETFSDALGRTVGTVVRNAANAVVTQSGVVYSADSHQVTTTTGTAGGAVTQTMWTDNAGKAVLLRHADGSFARTEYDAGGNAVSSTGETGQTTRTSYDGLNRVILTRLPDGTATQFVYAYLPGGGQRVERRMPQSLTEVAITDVAGRPAESYLQGAGSVQSRRYHSYQYYTAGKEKGLLKQYTDPRGLVHGVTYDDWQRQAATTVGTVGDASYVMREMLAYDVRGQLTQLKETTYAAVTEVLSAFDGQGHLDYQKTKLNGTVVTHLVNTYDGAGRRNGLTRGSDVSAVGSGVGGSWSFDHRADGLLAQVGFGGSTFSYTYGDNGLLQT